MPYIGPYIVNQALGSLRNDFTGCVGFRFTTGTVAPIVTSLGRWKVAGNTGTHTVYIKKTSDGSTVASASVDLTLFSAGAYAFVSITPVTLAASTEYVLMSSETNGGDQWYNQDTVVTPDPDMAPYITFNNAYYQPSCAGGFTGGTFGQSYVPPNMELQVPTRCYFNASRVADVSPSYDAGWDYTTEAGRYQLATDKNSTLTIGTQIGPWTGTAGQKALDRQFVSAPLSGAQTISGTVKMQLLVREHASDDNVDQLWVKIYVVSNDGSSVIGTLLTLGNYASTAEFLDTGYRNKKGLDDDTLSSVSANDGDRIVVEVGYSNSTGGTTPEASAKWGGTGTNLPENETQTTDGVGWILFSQAIAFAPEVRITQEVLDVIVAPTDANVRITQEALDVLVNPTSVNARITQLPVEAVIEPSSQNVRLSQIVVEVIYANSASVTQAGVEVLIGPDPNARLTQSGIEVLSDLNPNMRITQAGVETLGAFDPNSIVTQAGTEVLIDGDISVSGVVTQIGVEVLIDNMRGERYQVIFLQ